MRRLSLKVFPPIWGFWIGIAVFILALIYPLAAALPAAAQHMLAIVLLMIAWWISEAIPLGVTALLPLVLYPLLRIMPTSKVAPNYTDHLIFLFLGGFLISIALQEWQLHKRFALFTLAILGNNPRKILWAMMLSSGMISMWLSNTATVLMLLPICLALIHQLQEESDQFKDGTFKFAAVLLLAIAYGSSIGGIATPVGTPPNIIFLGIYAKFFPDSPSLSFFQWMLYMTPLSIFLLIFVWCYLGFVVLRKKDLPLTRSKLHFREKYRELGSLNVAQKWVLGIFFLTAILWIFRSEIDLEFYTFPGWPALLGLEDYIQDSTIAMGMSILLFVVQVPDASQRVPLLKLQNIFQIPWDIVLLFGGGFALAEGIQQSGLAEFIGSKLQFLNNFSPWLVLYLLTLSATIFTEFTSNTSVATTLLPITAVLASSIHFNPMFLMVPVTIACSCAFMLPVSTPPNAIVFGTRYIPIKIMAGIGAILVLTISFLVSLYFYLVFYFFPIN